MNQIVRFLEAKFTGVNTNPRRTAEELLAHILGCKPLEIYLREEPPPPEEFQTLEKLADRIVAGEPLQYVVGHVDFRGLEIKCDPRALIPRPETEQLVEEVLVSNVWKKPAPDIADIGTGTGCIVLSLAAERPNANYTAVDVSADALELARENARFQNFPRESRSTCQRGHVRKKFQWLEGSLLDGFAPRSMDAVVSNPPYISSNDWKQLEPCVRDREPQSALDSGPTGMELIERLAEQACSVLRPGGMLFLEFGFDQGEAVFQCLEKLGYADIRIKKDCAGHDRIAVAETQS